MVAFLPMIYVAWADGELAPAEMGTICERIRRLARLPEPCSKLLGRWLDPASPPSARDLQRLLATIRRRAAGLSHRERITLTELGVLLARAEGGVSEVERQALVAVEESLGVAGSEAARQLLATRRPAAGPVTPPASFPVAALTRYLDQPRAELRQRVREILRRPEFRYCGDDLDRAAYRQQVLAWCRALAAEGLGALSFPRRCGGRDDTAGFVAVFETLAHHDLSMLVKFGVQFGLFGGSILHLGTARHHDRYLKDAGSLELPGCFAMTETGHGSNVQDLETVATFDRERGEFVIHTPHPGARKDYIGNAACHGRLATVFAQLELDGESYGVHAFLVPIRRPDGTPCPGVEIEDCGAKLGLNGVDNGRLSFERVRVPRRNLLDRFATVDEEGRYDSPIPSGKKRFFTMLGTLVGGRVSIALAALSATKSALAIAIRYANRRRQFGPPGEAETALLDYRTHQRRLLPPLAATYGAHFALRHLAERYAATMEELDRREVETLAAGLKAFATSHATRTIQTCRECCGGQGYLAVNRFAALKADSDVFTTFEGDNTVLLQLVAKGLLTGLKKQFSEMNLFAFVRHVAGQAATSLAERNPVTTRLRDQSHLRDRDVQLAALRWRESHLLTTVARRLKKRLDRGEDSHAALIACQNHLVKTAEAHVERLILERFAAALEACPTPELTPVLTLLCDLFALERLEHHRAFFLEQGYFEPAKAKAQASEETLHRAPPPRRASGQR
ncbi:MAG: acyl-CoA oxidase, partial [Acidobacteria bacterium]